MKKSFLYLVLIVFFIGCGYKPASHYAKKEINGLVYTNIVVNIDSTSNSVLLKDTMNEIILTKLGASLTNNKKEADTIVDLNLSGVQHTTLTSDNEGYARSYRANVVILVKYTNKNKVTKSFTISDYYDYSVQSDASVSEQTKDNAVNNAVKKALEELVSKLAVSSFKE